MYICCMKNLGLLILVLPVLFALSSCNKANKRIKERITKSDSVAINYFSGDGTIDTVVAIKVVRDSKKMEQLVNYIAERSEEGNYKCGFDGSLHFFKMNKVIQDIDFRMNEKGCMYFTFVLDGKPQATALSPEAKELISSFRK